MPAFDSYFENKAEEERDRRLYGENKVSGCNIYNDTKHRGIVKTRAQKILDSELPKDVQLNDIPKRKKKNVFLVGMGNNQNTQSMILNTANIKKLISNCNKAFELQNNTFKLVFSSLLDMSDIGTVAQFKLITTSTISQNKYASIAVYEDGRIEVLLANSNHPFKIKLNRKVEIEQLITLILPDLMIYNNPISLTITQSISGNTNAKVVLNTQGKYACIHTNVIKQIMQEGMADIKNAKFAANGNIIVDYTNYIQTDYHTGPDNLWYD